MYIYIYMYMYSYMYMYMYVYVYISRESLEWLHLDVHTYSRCPMQKQPSLMNSSAGRHSQGQLAAQFTMLHENPLQFTLQHDWYFNDGRRGSEASILDLSRDNAVRRSSSPTWVVCTVQSNRIDFEIRLQFSSISFILRSDGAQNLIFCWPKSARDAGRSGYERSVLHAQFLRSAAGRQYRACTRVGHPRCRPPQLQGHHGPPPTYFVPLRHTRHRVLNGAARWRRTVSRAVMLPGAGRSIQPIGSTRCLGWIRSGGAVAVVKPLNILVGVDLSETRHDSANFSHTAANIDVSSRDVNIARSNIHTYLADTELHGNTTALSIRCHWLYVSWCIHVCQDSFACDMTYSYMSWLICTCQD